MALAEAISTAKNYILAGDPPERAIEDAAIENDLNPKLVRNRLVAQIGMEPAAWAVKQKAAEAAIIAASRANRGGDLRKAREEAAKWALEWRLSDQGRRLLGRTFTMLGEEHVFVVFSRNHPQWAIKAVRVKDGLRMKFQIGAWKKVYPQIATEQDSENGESMEGQRTDAE